MTKSTFAVHGVEVAYEVQGISGPWVTFSHSLGCTRHMWQPQIDALTEHHRVLSYDLPGHGDSGVAADVGSLSRLAADVRALLDHLAIAKTCFVGISIGGMIGQTLGIESPERVAGLVLANTTAYMPPPVVQMWEQRIALARAQGLGGIAKASLERWFPERFRGAQPDLMASMERVFAATSVQGYVACSQAIMALDTRARLADIRCPTLIIGGSEDPGAPPEALRLLQQGIHGAELHLLDGAGHLSSIDGAPEFTSAMTGLLRSV